MKVGDLVRRASWRGRRRNGVGVIVESANPNNGKMMMFRVYWFHRERAIGEGRWFGAHKLEAVKKCP